MLILVHVGIKYARNALLVKKIIHDKNFSVLKFTNFLHSTNLFYDFRFQYIKQGLLIY